MIRADRISLADAPDVMSVDEARRVLGVSRNSIYEAIRRGELPHVWVGHRICIPKKGLIAFLDNCNGSNGRGSAPLPAGGGGREREASKKNPVR